MTLPQLDNQAYTATTDRPGDLALLGLAIAARQTSLEGISRGNLGTLTGQSFGDAHMPLIEGVSIITAQLLLRANALPQQMIVAMLTAAGIPFKTASSSQVDVYVDNASTTDVTWVRNSVVGGGRVQFEVARTVTVPAGAIQYGPVPLSCVLRGPVGNVQARLSDWVAITPIRLTNIQNPQPAQGGANAETPADYALRAGELANSRGVAGRASDAEALALTVPGIQRVKALEHTFLTTGARWGYFPWGVADYGAARFLEKREGMLTLMVRAFGGGYLPSELASAVSAFLEPLRPYAAALNIVSPEEVRVDVTVEVRSDGILPDSVLYTNIRNTLNALLNGATFPWGGTLRQGEITAALDRTPGVAEVLSINSFPNGAEGDLWLASTYDGNTETVTARYPNVLFIAGTLNITVSR
jgi:uncharacterized phage protein gp47/JayE